VDHFRQKRKKVRCFFKQGESTSKKKTNKKCLENVSDIFTSVTQLEVGLGPISSTYLQNVGEIEQQFFCPTMRAGDFSIGALRLVKLTPDGNHLKVNLF